MLSTELDVFYATMGHICLTLELKENVIKAIKAAELKLKNSGRLLIRKSGTEPLIRVMAECEDEEKMNRAVDSVVAEITA